MGLINSRIFMETPMVRVMAATPAMTVARRSGHHSNNQQRQTHEISDRTTYNRHDDGYPLL
jgi:hypothetical protein